MLPKIEKQVVKKEKRNACKIRIKKSADGKVIEREISEGCTPQQIKALIESGNLAED